MDEERLTLKNGRYFTDDEQQRAFSAILDIDPIDNQSYDWTEMSIGELFAEVYRPNTLFCPEAKEWYIYDGRRWVKDVNGINAMERLKVFIKLLLIYTFEKDNQDDSKIADYRKFVNRLFDRRARERIIKDAQGEAMVSVSTFDSNPYLVNCQNGTYHLDKGKLLPHNSADYLTMMTNCKCPTEASAETCLRWYEFIDEITCKNAYIAQYIQTALGYCLLGSSKEECMFIAYGKTTRNGKGTLFNTICQILGDYAKSMPVDFICQNKYGSQNYDRPNPMLAGLRGKRFVTLSESDSAGKLDEAVIKNYTGGDPITTRNLHEKDFTFIPQFKMWLSCNSLPAVQDKSLFSSNRLKVIEFNAHFDKDKIDTRLKEQFLAEEAKIVIFKWLTDGYSMYVRKGLKEPKQVEESVLAYEKSNDRVGMFIDERCEKGEEFKYGRGELYSVYKTWCNNNGLKPLSAPKFNEQLSTHAKQIRVHGVNFWKGIRVRSFTVKLDDNKEN